MRRAGLLLGIATVVGCQAGWTSRHQGESVAPAQSTATRQTIEQVSAQSVEAPELAPPIAISGARVEAGSAVEEDPLTLVATCLERGERNQAVIHLDSYVRLHPDQIMFRAHLAELEFQVDRLEDATIQFESFIALAQDKKGTPHNHMVHCHTRLMEIHRRSGDTFKELFHRGAGLLQLSQQMAQQRMSESGEEILCQAFKALTSARELRPNDARTNFYLSQAFEAMGNHRSALIARANARRFALAGDLTTSEQQILIMSR